MGLQQVELEQSVSSLTELGLTTHHATWGKCQRSDLFLRICCCNIEDTHTPHMGWKVCAGMQAVRYSHMHCVRTGLCTLWTDALCAHTDACTPTQTNTEEYSSGRHPMHSQATRSNSCLHANCNVFEPPELHSTQVIYVHTNQQPEREWERECYENMKANCPTWKLNIYDTMHFH